MQITVTFNSVEEMLAFNASDITGKKVEEVVKIEKSEPVTKAKETEEAKVPAITEIRAAATNKCREGKQAEVSALLSSFGVEKLTDLKQEDYSAFMKKVGEL